MKVTPVKRNATLKTLIVFAAVTLLFFILNLLFPLPDKIEYSTIITDDRNEVIHAFLTSDEKWRLKTQLHEISPLLKKIIVEKEDKYFYYHPGINFPAVSRAFVKNLFRRKRTSGASTITMQVARAMEPKKRTYVNKAVEMFRALQLELKYSKPEILQLYLNLVPYGGNIEGVKSAALLYFRKSPDHLSLAEITALSIIPNRPSSLVIGRNNDLVVKERNRWLKTFAADRICTEKEIADALQEPLNATRGSVPRYVPHLAHKLKSRGTNIIETGIQLNTQLKIEKLVQDYSRGLYVKNIRNAAVVVIDNKTHRVISYLGSASFLDTLDGGQVNGAAATRQPGSTLKPLLYALCIDNGLMTPKMVLNDVPVNYDGYAPENYDKTFNGYVTMEYALEHSLNIPAVRSLRLLGKNKLVNSLAYCDFRQVKKDQGKLGLSMILGGCGASLEELAGLYSCFANGGLYTKPSLVIDVKDRKKERIVSSASAFMISEMLSKVNRPDFPLSWQSTERMPKIAWKTGTSYGRRDAWSIGYNKKYTVGVWVGNFSGLGIPELSGAEIATPMLFKIFNTIDYDSDEEWFSQTKDCSSSVTCNNTKEVILSADEKMSYCPGCLPQNGYRKKRLRILSPEMQSYFAGKRVSYEKIPPHNPACEVVVKEGAPVITFPSNNSEYLISSRDPQPLQLTCNTGSDVTKVYWYINDRFYKTAPAGTKQFFIPEEGPTKISCTDDQGRNKDIRITVKYVNL
jgi:penicillin-binding protein 1C